MLHLSQGQLTVLDLCPRRFQHSYLDQLAFPLSPEEQERLQWGSRFHLLMQQYELELPIEPAFTDPTLYHCARALQQEAPELFRRVQSHQRQSEHRRTLEFQGFLLTVIYDLLILEPAQAQLVDWKTYLRPSNVQRLEESWQTQLYLFVLAETSTYAPEQISMTYWFVQDPETPPQYLSFFYQPAWHDRIRHRLTEQLNQLSLWLQQYAAGQAFPQVSETAGVCPSCPFARRCQRLGISTHLPIWDLAAIEEVPL